MSYLSQKGLEMSGKWPYSCGSQRVIRPTSHETLTAQDLQYLLDYATSVKK